MYKHFRAAPGRYGTIPNTVAVTRQSDITASATVSTFIPLPFRKGVIGRLGITMATLPAGSSTVTATFIKYSKSAAADVSLSAATNIKSGGSVTVKETANIALLTTLTEANLTFLEGDSLRVDVIAGGTVTTQPVNMAFSAEYLLQS
ncbi:MAG: hypothetical protein ABIS03_10220 [Gemmatimonadaceae bacterium]